MTLLLALVSVTMMWAEDVVLTSSHTTWEDGNTYVLDNNVTISERITVNGTVQLVLGEGCTLHAPKGITLGKEKQLSIYGMGMLTIDNCTGNDPGIGAYEVGTLIINGGTINAKGGTYAAGLGGSVHNLRGGTIIINGGVVNATGGYRAAGIGGGSDDWAGNYGRCGDIIINGGQVTATGGNSAYGIGPGYPSDGDASQSGTVVLGWRKPTDLIYAKGGGGGYSPRIDSLAFASGKSFLLDGTETAATLSNISGQKIVPLLRDPGLWGDMNGDGSLTIADVTLLVDAVLNYTLSHEVTAPYGHEYVDLGLPSGTLWATTNVGATNPEDYGDYFGWGETVPYGKEDLSNAMNYNYAGTYVKTYYNWDTYKWCEGAYNTMTKYCTNSIYGYNGFVDDKSELDPEDDAATANWGSKWQMPSEDQLYELQTNCTRNWTQRNNVNGCELVGPNGNSIFLPAAGYRATDYINHHINNAFCWSRTLSSNCGYSWEMRLSSSEAVMNPTSRLYGMPVRPVRKQ